MVTVFLFLDLKKSLDKVDHNIILKKLPICGISPASIEWFHEYSSNRMQVTKASIRYPILELLGVVYHKGPSLDQ